MRAIRTDKYRIWIAQRNEAIISARMESAVASTEASLDLADPMGQDPSVNYYNGHMVIFR